MDVRNIQSRRIDLAKTILIDDERVRAVYDAGGIDKAQQYAADPKRHHVVLTSNVKRPDPNIKAESRVAMERMFCMSLDIYEDK